jgi:hypothetical protein
MRALFTKNTLLFFKWAFVGAIWSWIALKILRHPLDNPILLLGKAFLFENGVLIFSLFLGLAFLNWALEGLKWKVILSSHSPVPFSLAFKSVLAGAASGIFTPNRIGEIFGRLSVLPSRFLLNNIIPFGMISSFSALLVTGTFGWFALIFLPAFFHEFKPENTGSLELLVSVASYALVASVILLWIFLLVLRPRFMNKFKAKWLQNLAHFRAFSIRTWTLAFTISFLRYLIFFFQTALVLYWFGIVGFSPGSFLLIPVFFFCISLLPGIRGSIALFVFSMVSDDSPAILLAVFLIWLVNIGLPALVGTYFISSLKLKSKD